MARATVRLSCRSMISSWPVPSPPSLNNSTEYFPSVSNAMPLTDLLVAVDLFRGLAAARDGS